ncbi:MAG: hypothetical protein RLZZ338_3602 [Cyanobacteriota bacterium]|jgi:hypothetical protein
MDKQKQRSPQRLLLLQVTTVLISLGISLLLGEFILRAFAWYNSSYGVANIQKQEKPYEFSPSRHHRLKPNFRYRHKDIEYDYLWENNALGMRDRERSITKDSNTFRILVLGDSMVQGYGVPLEQSMVYLLEKNLNQNSKLSQKIEILNGGTFGYSPFLEFLYLQELMPSIKPDLVMVAFFVGNDVGDDYFYTQQAKFNSGGSATFTTLKWPWDYRNKVLKKESNKTTLQPQEVTDNSSTSTKLSSKVLSSLKSLLLKSQLVTSIVNLQKSAKKIEEERIALKQQKEITKKYQDDIRVNLSMIAYPTSTRQERLKYWDISLSYLKKMHQLCEKKQIPMVLVVIPKLEPEVVNFTEPNEILDEFAKTEKITMLRLLADLKQIPPEKLYYELDGHWNRTGNELVEKIIEREFLKTNLLPTSLKNSP